MSVQKCMSVCFSFFAACVCVCIRQGGREGFAAEGEWKAIKTL